MRLLFFEIKGSILAVIVVAAVFLGALFWGASRGKANALAEANLAQSLQLAKGLDNFYQDQNRFPTAEELQNENIALIYFSAAINNLSPDSACSQNFLYNRLSLTSYQLSFCLAADAGQYQKGWNQLAEQK